MTVAALQSTPAASATAGGDRPLRVCVVLSGLEAYGTETYLRQLFDVIDANPRLALHILALCDGDFVESIAAQRPIHRTGIPPFKALRGPGGKRSIAALFREARRAAAIVRRGRRLLATIDPDLIHTHAPQAHVLTSMLLRGRPTPLLWHWHGPYNQTGIAHRAVRWAARRPALGSLCISRFVESTLPPELQPNAAVLYNCTEVGPTPPARTGALREMLGLAPDTVLVAALGRCVPHKGFEYFVRAAAAIHADHPAAAFAVIGGSVNESGDAEQRRLEQLARELGVADRVRFTGHIPDARRLIPDCDVIVAPTIRLPDEIGEGFGLVVIEAMAANVATVVSDNGAFPEIVTNEKTGLIVPEADSAALAAALSRLIADPALRARLAEQGRRHVAATFAVDRFAADLEARYQAAMQRTVTP